MSEKMVFMTKRLQRQYLLIKQKIHLYPHSTKFRLRSTNKIVAMSKFIQQSLIYLPY